MWDGWRQFEPTARDTQHGLLRQWCEVGELERSRVLLRLHNHFESSDELVVEESDLAFRDRGILTDQLRRAGFEVDAVRGDWQRTPFDGTHLITVFEAHAV